MAGGEGFGVAVGVPALEDPFGPLPAACDVVADATDLLSQLFDAHYRSLCRLAYVLLGDAGAGAGSDRGSPRCAAGRRRLAPGPAGAPPR